MRRKFDFNEAFRAGNRARKQESVQDTIDSVDPLIAWPDPQIKHEMERVGVVRLSDMKKCTALDLSFDEKGDDINEVIFDFSTMGFDNLNEIVLRGDNLAEVLNIPETVTSACVGSWVTRKITFKNIESVTDHEQKNWVTRKKLFRKGQTDALSFVDSNLEMVDFGECPPMTREEMVSFISDLKATEIFEHLIEPLEQHEMCVHDMFNDPKCGYCNTEYKFGLNGSMTYEEAVIRMKQWGWFDE